MRLIISKSKIILKLLMLSIFFFNISQATVLGNWTIPPEDISTYTEATRLNTDIVYNNFDEQLEVENNGWTWNELDRVGIETELENIYSPSSSIRFDNNTYWGGFGVKPRVAFYQKDNWSIDLNPEYNTQLSFWIKSYSKNKMNDKVLLQIYDNGEHSTNETKAEAWTTEYEFSEWTRIDINFDDLPETLNLNDINKIELVFYWPGIYFVDEMKSTVPSELNVDISSDGKLRWEDLSEEKEYLVEKKLEGNNWEEIHKGINNEINISPFIKTDYKVTNLLGKNKPSKIINYEPPFVVINHEKLRKLNKLNIISPEIFRSYPGIKYRIEKSPNGKDSWEFKDFILSSEGTVNAEDGHWYRVRPENNSGDFGPWSPPVSNLPVFLKASDQILVNSYNKEQFKTKGVNIGGALALEPWMIGFGDSNDEDLNDEESIRRVLDERFGNDNTEQLLSNFNRTFVSEEDFDNIYRLDFNTVRLPVNYKALVKDNGEFDFTEIDYHVNALSNRNIYTLIDLHGTPGGGQSKTPQSGEFGVCHLFEQNEVGVKARQETIAIWKEIAIHYADNPMIMGYDLLNEPNCGEENPELVLWPLYNDLYKTIREVDNNHIIMMEAVWELDSLPNPKDFGWENISYQLHYYNWDATTIIDHQYYLAWVVEELDMLRHEYNVPLVVGEFTAFNHTDYWDLYVNTFQEEQLGWIMWSYKTYDQSAWGVYSCTRKDKPDILSDDYNTINSKITDSCSKSLAHRPLIEILKKY